MNQLNDNARMLLGYPQKTGRVSSNLPWYSLSSIIIMSDFPCLQKLWS